MNDFNEELASNTKDAMVSAMLRTVVSDPSRSLGSILDALDIEGDETGNLLMDHFRDVTVGELVTAAVEHMKREGMVPQPDPEELPNAREPVPPPPDSEAGPEDNLEDEPTSEAPRGGKKKSRKKKPPRSSGTRVVKPEDTKAYQKSLLTFLRKGGHRDEDTGASAREIRAEIGGDKDQFKDVIDQLVESKHIAKYGQAAGTRYYLP